MTERWGDRDVSEDTCLIVDRLESIDETLRRLADVAEFMAARYGYGQPTPVVAPLPPANPSLIGPR